MNTPPKPHQINYTFHVQSPEDFHRQLREWCDQHYPETKPLDTKLAQQLLESIGVHCA